RSWGRALIVIARLRDRLRIEAAASEMAAVADRLAEEIPADRGWSVHVAPLAAEIAGDARAPLVALLGAPLVLLATAVTTVGPFTRALFRRLDRELSVRRAIGATERRLFGQLFWPTAVVGIVGTLVGLAGSVPGAALLSRLAPPDLPRAGSVQLDLPVLAAGAAAGLLATLPFGVAAASRGCRGAGPLTRSPSG